MSIIKLRYPDQRDAEWMLKEEQSPEATAYSDFDADYTLGDIKNFIDLNRTGADPSQARLIVDVDGKAAGMIDLTGISKKNGHADIGLYISKKFRGQGVGTEALREAVQIAAMMGVTHMKALIAAGNKASMRLFEKVGFEKIGVLPGWLHNGKENGAIFYLSVMGEDIPDSYGRDATMAGMDEFSLYGLNDDASYGSPFSGRSGIDDEDDDDGYGGGYESIDDYIDKI